ncbi:50S ribosomal protein L15 [Candidatus Saccharibacteria bacterium]|nr:50S ribosomal protein L15 [Candidatus Saccharibacteria bacterium]
MKYNDLNVEKNTRPVRKGRGISAGQGKTAGRGTKGQKSRTGHRKMPAGFMGGQRAIMQAVPKLKGFKSIHAKAEVVYIDRLNELKGSVDNFALYDAGLISTPYAKVKVISRGELTSKVDLSTQFASKTAVETIKKAGGSFTKVAVPARKTSEDSRKGASDKPAKAAKESK